MFDELLELGFEQSYPTMTRQIRARGLRPACEPCRPATGRAVAVIDHPPGEETQWDWVELPDPPPAWGWPMTLDEYLVDTGLDVADAYAGDRGCRKTA